MQMRSLFRTYFNLLLFPLCCHAGTGLFFDITETGPYTSPLDIKLALNGIGPVTIQNYSINSLEFRVRTTVPDHTYPFAGIKIDSPGYRIAGFPRTNKGYYLFSVSDTSPANITLIPPNFPWYPSLEAFEHYNSGRSHVFPEAVFGGSYLGNNTVDILNSPMVYPISTRTTSSFMAGVMAIYRALLAPL